MKVLVLGNGAREHAITWKFSKSKRISGLYIGPGNAGTAELGTNLHDVNPMDSQSVIAACKKHLIDFVFVGPEGPLAAGIVDSLSQAGIHAIGPHQKAAQLESSKAFSKDFMKRNKIPTADAVQINEIQVFKDYISKTNKKIVLKKSGLAAGKGVLESADKAELLKFGLDILKNDTLLIEEFLEGFEVSLFTISDGKNYKVLPPTSDYKKAMEGDMGPNTGGMGSVCPVPWVDNILMDRIIKEIVEPTQNALIEEGLSYKGILFYGLMITKNGPYLLEYNSRFGDPETQSLLAVIENDFGNLCDVMISQEIDIFPLKVSEKSAVTVVVAAPGYPGEYPTGIPVKKFPKTQEGDCLVFHAGTKLEKNRVVTGGGRCFSVVATGKDLLEASSRAYAKVKELEFQGMWYRTDIAKKYFYE